MRKHETRLAEDEKAMAPDFDPIPGRPGYARAYKGTPIEPPARFEKNWGYIPKPDRLRFFDTQHVQRSEYRRAEGGPYELVHDWDGVLVDGTG